MKSNQPFHIENLRCTTLNCLANQNVHERHLWKKVYTGHGQLIPNPKQNFTRNFYRLTGAARHKTAKRKTPETRQSEKTRTKKKLLHTRSKDDFNHGISKLLKEK